MEVCVIVSAYKHNGRSSDGGYILRFSVLLLYPYELGFVAVVVCSLTF